MLGVPEKEKKPHSDRIFIRWFHFQEEWISKPLKSNRRMGATIGSDLGVSYLGLPTWWLMVPFYQKGVTSKKKTYITPTGAMLVRGKGITAVRPTIHSKGNPQVAHNPIESVAPHGSGSGKWELPGMGAGRTWKKTSCA